MIRSLLVPLDGSPFAEQALPLAVALARQAGAAIHLARVHVPVDLALPEGVVRLAGETGLAVTAALLEGRVADALEEKAKAASVDLMVLTTHGRGPLGRFWLGSVADTLVRHLPMPRRQRDGAWGCATQLRAVRDNAPGGRLQHPPSSVTRCRRACESIPEERPGVSEEDA